eukprot:TRINITY_DN74741_c0_g1_i1.p1 TRINITY_DN74741_c0_g1~~TRINITY_DN74741_c0_g1_i1.p1  ORF type:complete len:157 (-),score=25.68 TRINITY_DN74741_c0_g1_i1:145-615(-)
MCKTVQDVEELLCVAAAASAAAPTRAARRRVRQRLHKKLGPVMSDKEFEEAMGHLKVAKDQRAMTAPHQSADHPLEAGLVTQSWIQHFQQSRRACRQEKRSLTDPTPACSTQGIQPETEDQNVAAWTSKPLPVARTFIHFDEHLESRRRQRRSLSV